jgi:hypothetical protein
MLGHAKTFAIFAALSLGWPILCGTALLAAPPQINGISPFGARRGTATEVTISGSNLSGNPRLIAPFGFQVNSPKTGGDASSWKLKVTIDPSTAVGAYVIRVQTDDGISNPFLWSVGQLPQVEEKEDNSAFETAQPIPDPPLVVEGQVAGNDVDYFRFRGRKGELIVVDAQCARIGSGIDPTIRLTTATASRTYVASADDSPGLLTDARLTAVLPADGDYVVELSDSRYQGGGRPIYRLVIGAVPMAEEVFPLGGRSGDTLGLELRGGTLGGLRIAAANLGPSFGTDRLPARIETASWGGAATSAVGFDVESVAALVVSPYPELRESTVPEAAPIRAVAPVVFNGRIDPPGDDDRFVLVTAPGQRLRITVQASELGSALDGVLRVLGNNNAILANVDDTTIPQPRRNNQRAQPLVLADPSLELTVPAGTREITLAIRDLENRGGVGFPYRIVALPVIPDFEIQPNDFQVSVPRGGAAALGVTIRRTGYTGPITVTVADPPAGLTRRPGMIAAGQNTGVLSLGAAADAAFPPAAIKLLGRGQGPDGPFERVAFKRLVFAQQANMTTCALDQIGLVAAPAPALPVDIETPSAPVEIPHGFVADIPVKVVRKKGADSSIVITPLPLPAGLTFAGATIAENAAEGKVMVKAALAAPLGMTTLGMRAKGKLGGLDRTFDLAAVTLNVVPPASLELSAAHLEIRPGATAELVGKIVRKGAFDGAVTVKLSGLPAGLKADPVTVTGSASRFLVKVAADAKSAATTAGSQVAMAFQVDKKDYSVPPAPLSIKVLPLK